MSIVTFLKNFPIAVILSIVILVYYLSNQTTQKPQTRKKIKQFTLIAIVWSVLCLLYLVLDTPTPFRFVTMNELVLLILYILALIFDKPKNNCIIIYILSVCSTLSYWIWTIKWRRRWEEFEDTNIGKIWYTTEYMTKIINKRQKQYEEAEAYQAKHGHWPIGWFNIPGTIHPYTDTPVKWSQYLRRNKKSKKKGKKKKTSALDEPLTRKLTPKDIFEMPEFKEYDGSWNYVQIIQHLKNQAESSVAQSSAKVTRTKLEKNNIHLFADNKLTEIWPIPEDIAEQLKRAYGAVTVNDTKNATKMSHAEIRTFIETCNNDDTWPDDADIPNKDSSDAEFIEFLKIYWAHNRRNGKVISDDSQPGKIYMKVFWDDMRAKNVETYEIDTNLGAGCFANTF